jgi:glycosyltransferase involved in cell wall biosynthesis
MKYDLSIVIPALREEFLSLTVQDIIKNKRGKTEVIAVLDGEWADPPIEDHPDVRVIYTKNLGQRGATNLGVKLSTAKYVAKCDAHCAFDEGFDVKLIEGMQGNDNWTIVPVMRNMHIFNWKCLDCGDETYQGPPPEGCKNCDVNTPDRFEKVIKWYPKPSPNSSAYKFTPNRLQFKYFGSLKNKQHKLQESIVETMSLQGSFFMLTREKYWELNICDESWGGWGQQGTEVALKTWLSGGRVVVNLDTWYAHMFRTQGGFAFPWGNPAKQQQKARSTSWELFYENKWDKQTRPLSWLVERFWDELQQEPHKEDDPKWTKEDLEKVKSTEGRFRKDERKELTRGILYFTDNELPLKIAKNVQGRIRKIAQEKNMKLVSSSRKPMDNMGINVVTPEPRGYLTMFKQILKGLQTLDTDIVFMAEADVLYPPEHFNFTPTAHKFYYDVNWYKVHSDGLVVSWKADQVSGLCAFREDLLQYYQWRVDTFDKEGFDRKFEPFSGERSEQWEASVPHIDIRTGKNLTYNKRSLDDFRKKETAVDFKETTIDKIPGWQLSLEDIY